MNTAIVSNSTLIPIFFAVDDKYAPYLSVALRSLIDNASPAYDYRIHILIDSLSEKTKMRLLSMQTENVKIDFVSVRKKLEKYIDKLHMRDYYTQATYYRFVIPELFPEYSRCIYLDCDILVLGDISKLYAADLDGKLMAAIPEEVMAAYQCFLDYSEKFLGVPYKEYFNAGILVMNLDEMRRIHIEDAFIRIMDARKFTVAQDQDYLNVLCLGKITYLDASWNLTAFPDSEKGGLPNLVHFKLNYKPWHYDNIDFGNYFWQYAERTPFLADLQEILASYTDAERERDAEQFANLMALADAETASIDDNYELPTVFSVCAMEKECQTYGKVC